MTAYEVAIPSYHRSHLLPKRTVPMLVNGGVAPGRITVFVSDVTEMDAYRTSLDSYGYSGVRLAEGASGMAGNRNAIARAYPAGVPVLNADDDLEGISRRVGSKRLEPVADVHGLIETGFRLVRQHGYTLWGVYPVLNAYFMKPGYTADLRFCVGTFFGVLNRPTETITIPCKEDYERTLMRWERDGGVIRFNDVAIHHKYAVNPGGMQDGDERTIETTRLAAEALSRRWPGVVKLNTRRSDTEYTEITLKTPRRAR